VRLFSGYSGVHGLFLALFPVLASIFVADQPFSSPEMMSHGMTSIHFPLAHPRGARPHFHGLQRQQWFRFEYQHGGGRNGAGERSRERAQFQDDGITGLLV
jgi:hypothetical protein